VPGEISSFDFKEFFSFFEVIFSAIPMREQIILTSFRREDSACWSIFAKWEGAKNPQGKLWWR
jgi:hypothetical protein